MGQSLAAEALKSVVGKEVGTVVGGAAGWATQKGVERYGGGLAKHLPDGVRTRFNDTVDTVTTKADMWASDESVAQHGAPEESTGEVTGHWLSRTEKRLDEKLQEAFPQMTTEHLLNGGDDRRAISVTEMDDDWEEDYVITLEEPRVDDGRVVEYQVTVTAESVIIDMVDRFEVSEEARVEAFSHAAIIDEVVSKHDPSFEAATPTVEVRF